MAEGPVSETERRRALHREYQRRYRANHAEVIRAQKRKYRQENGDALRAYGRKYQSKYRREHTEAIRTAKREYRHTRRARWLSVYAEVIDPTEIFTRDRWRCKACGCKTPQELRGTNEPNAPTLDHAIPLSLGGPHTKANTRCLCRQCNSIKSAQYEGQLAFA